MRTSAPPRASKAQKIADKIVAQVEQETKDLADLEVIDHRAAALNAALGDNDDDDDFITMGNEADPTVKRLPTPAEIATDYSKVDTDKLIDFSPEYVYDWQKTEDGNDYRLRLVAYSPAVVVMHDAAPDGFQLDASVRQSGRNGEFDFYWNSDSNPVASQEAHRTGFVKVKAEDWEDPTNTYRKEGGKVVNGDLYLMKRPKSVTEIRAIEHKNLSDRLMGVTKNSQVETFGNMANSDYGRIEEFTMQSGVSSREDVDPTTLRAISHAEQVYEGRNAARGKKSYAVNAPFQKTIVGGRVVHDPGLVALVGGGR